MVTELYLVVTSESQPFSLAVCMCYVGCHSIFHSCFLFLYGMKILNSVISRTSFCVKVSLVGEMPSVSVSEISIHI